jgi:membrane protein
LLERIVEVLVRRGFLAETNDDPPGFLPARALDTVTVKEVLDAIRSAEEEGSLLGPAGLPREPRVEALLSDVDAAVEASLRDRTLRDLVTEASGAPAAVRSSAASS